MTLLKVQVGGRSPAQIERVTLLTLSVKLLNAPAEYKPLGAAGVEMIRSRYSLDVCLPQMLGLYERAADAYRTRG